MSDSLREQMLKAGFKETPSNKKKKTQGKAKRNKRTSGANKQSGSTPTATPSSMELANIAKREAAATRKRVKAEIKAIIEAEKIEQTAGETPHSYLVGKRIKQMFVSEPIQKQLVEGVLVITRLNGSTYLIPTETGVRIKALNPDWVVITPASDNANEIDEDYADYQVPDDLKW